MRSIAGAILGLWVIASGGAEAPDAGQAVVSPSISVVAAGDIADCGSDGLQFPDAFRTAGLIAPTDALVLTLGDNTYPVGAATEFADCFQPTWGGFKEKIRPSPGNHDYMTTDAGAYFDYFGAAAGPDRRGYYSFDAGGWHFISLNSNADAGVGSAQYAWLQADLAANSDTLCTLAYWHHPVFSSGPHGNDRRMADAFQLLHAAGAEIVLVGHDHIYERFRAAGCRGQRRSGARSPQLHGRNRRRSSLFPAQAATEQRSARCVDARRAAPDAEFDRLSVGVRPRFGRCAARRRRGGLPPLGGRHLRPPQSTWFCRMSNFSTTAGPKLPLASCGR